MKYEIQTLDPVSYNDSTWYLSKEDGEGGSLNSEELIEFIKAENKEEWFYKWL